jgi:hypothetical protein
VCVFLRSSLFFHLAYSSSNSILASNWIVNRGTEAMNNFVTFALLVNTYFVIGGDLNTI